MLNASKKFKELIKTIEAIKSKKNSLNSIRKWYAKETGREIKEFDDYDLHVCRVVFLYVNNQ